MSTIKTLYNNLIHTVFVSLIFSVLLMNWLVKDTPWSLFFTPTHLESSNHLILNVDLDYSNNTVAADVSTARNSSCAEVQSQLGTEPIEVRGRTLKPVCKVLTKKTFRIEYKIVPSL